MWRSILMEYRCRWSWSAIIIPPSLSFQGKLEFSLDKGLHKLPDKRLFAVGPWVWIKSSIKDLSENFFVESIGQHHDLFSAFKVTDYSSWGDQPILRFHHLWGFSGQNPKKFSGSLTLSSSLPYSKPSDHWFADPNKSPKSPKKLVILNQI